MNDELVQYRRERSLETLRAAELLVNNDLLFAAVNRIYYACFYEVIALLLSRDLSSAKHSGIKALFNRNFVNSGLVSVVTAGFMAICLNIVKKPIMWITHRLKKCGLLRCWRQLEISSVILKKYFKVSAGVLKTDRYPANPDKIWNLPRSL